MKRTRSLILVINLCLFCKLCAQNLVTEIETEVAAVRYAQLFLQYKESCEERRATGETSDLVGGGIYARDVRRFPHNPRRPMRDTVGLETHSDTCWAV